jgi:hypothetical protein
MYLIPRVATVDFWQARLLQWELHHWCAITAADAFYFTKSREDCGLAGLTSSGVDPATVVIR